MDAVVGRSIVEEARLPEAGEQAPSRPHLEHLSRLQVSPVAIDKFESLLFLTSFEHTNRARVDSSDRDTCDDIVGDLFGWEVLLEGL